MSDQYLYKKWQHLYLIGDVFRYYKEISITYDDGLNLIVTVDQPTYRLVLNRDAAILASIRSNWLQSEVPEGKLYIS